ncbi:branched-chain amino acid aminotransferase 2, chloroplastic-like protein [Tanacetum coccineum]
MGTFPRRFPGVSRVSLFPRVSETSYGIPAAFPCNLGLFEGLKAYRKEDGNISFFRLEEKCYKDDHRCTTYVHAFSFCCSVYEAVKATVLANENERWIPPPGKGSLYIRPLLMGSGSVLDLAPATELAVRLGWSLSNHYWCRYPECKLYGKTSKGLFEGLKAYRKEDGNISFFRLEEKCYKDDHRCTAYVHAFSFCCSVYEDVKATVLANENERWIPLPGKGSLYIRPLLMVSGSVLDLAPATEYSFLIYVS